MGDVPGELLSDRPGRTKIDIGRLRSDEDLVVTATYVGGPSSASLVYEVSASEEGGGAAGGYGFLPMGTSDRVKASTDVPTRAGLPIGYDFCSEEIILRDPERWIVHDVKVGLRSQTLQAGDLPGEIFGASTSGGQISLDAIRGNSIDLTLSVKYVGKEPGGERIVCGAVGRVLRLKDQRDQPGSAHGTSWPLKRT